MGRLRYVLMIIFALSPLILMVSAKADVTAAVLGRVTDAKRAAIPNAQVELTNSETGYHRQLTADGQGDYEFLSVPVGSGYAITVTSAGFDKSSRPGITLQVNQQFRADITLEVGMVAQKVSVSASTVQVDTTTSQVGDVITARKMTALPLNGRSYTDLLGLQPGVVPINSGVASNDRSVSGELNPGTVSVNGNRESGNAFLINGGNVEEPKNNGAAVIPNLDAIQEFRVLTDTYDAEYGRFAGGIVNVITKSGTNDFHGSVLEFLRNEKLNAKNYFDQDQVNPSTGLPIPNTARGIFKRNQFGYTFGGPIVKNRLFFFSDYQGTREVRGLSGTVAYVPSKLEASGNFSDAAGTGYSPLNSVVKGEDSGNHTMVQTLTQRLGYKVRAGEPYWMPGCDSPGDGPSGMCVFPGQIIPQSAWDPGAAGTIKFIPAPSAFRGGTPVFTTSSLENRLNDDKIGEQVTWNDPRTGDWSFYFSYDNTSAFNPYGLGNIPGFSGTIPQKAYQGVVSNTHIFNGTTVNVVRLNYTRSTIFQQHPSGVGIGSISSFGFPDVPLGIKPSVPSIEGVPLISIGGGYDINMGVAAQDVNQTNNAYEISDVLSKIIGKHSLKLGGQAMVLQVNEANLWNSNGDFSFDGSETGNGFADYLLGAVDGFSQESFATFFTRSNYGGIFVQDSYRLLPNVTINAGLRWDFIQPWYEAQGRLNAIVWGQQSTLFPGSPTGWVFPGDRGLPKGIASTPLDDLSPRFGIAWSPAATEGVVGKLFGGPGKSSIRLGTGYYYQSIEDQPSFHTIGDAPFGLFYSSPTQVYLSQPFEDRRHDNDPGQRFPFVPPMPGQPVDWSTYLPIGGSPGVFPGNVTPVVLQFNLAIERELPGSSILTLSYVGSRGRHLSSQTESNPGNSALCLQVQAEMPAGEGCGPFGEDQIYALPNGQAVNGTRPHSVTSGRLLSQGRLDFTSNPYNMTSGNSYYDAFEASWNKQAGWFQFLAGYTWSKAISDTSGTEEPVDPFDPARSRSLSAFDMSQNFVVSYNFALPALSASRALVRESLGGWNLSGISRFTTGLPVTLTQYYDQSLRGIWGLDTPNWDGKPIKTFNPRSSSSHAYFDASQFSLQPLGTEGNASRRFFHGPGIDNWDMALRKMFPIRDRYSLEFRAEFFNVFNHTQFNNPNGEQSAASFGQVSTARDPRIGQVALRFAF